MTEPAPTPDDQAQQDADSALYDSIYGARERAPLSDEAEALHAAFYRPAAPAPLTDEDQHLYNSLIPEN
jgi:hypothetical protein